MWTRNEKWGIALSYSSLEETLIFDSTPRNLEETFAVSLVLKKKVRIYKRLAQPFIDVLGPRGSKATIDCYEWRDF